MPESPVSESLVIGEVLNYFSSRGQRQKPGIPPSSPITPRGIHSESSPAKARQDLEAAPIGLLTFSEIKQIEQVADGRHVGRHIGMAVLNGIG